MPNPSDYDDKDKWMAACVPVRKEEGDKQDEAVATCLSTWRKHAGEPESKAANALKAISRTDDELRVGNYIVLFGGRDLEGIASENKNQDGSLGEFFTAETDLESAYTKAGMLYEDWEHGQGELGDELLGVVDWKTARVDDKGVFVERVLNRRNQYVQWLEELGWFDDGTLGTSSHADPKGVVKRADGEIMRWPLFRDTITVQPMEPRNLTENHIRAFKALGIPMPAQDDTANDSIPPEAEPEADTSAASAAGKGRMRMQLLKNRLTMEA